MDHIAHETLRRIRDLAQVAAPDPRREELCRQVSVPRILLAGAEMRRFDGADAEYLVEQARTAGVQYDPTRPRLGWDLLCRADTVATANTGGYLVATDRPTAADALRPTTIAFQLGASSIEAKSNVAIPRQTGIATAQWLGSETTVATAVNQTLSDLGLNPKTVSVYTEASRQLLLQSNADAIILRDIMRAVGNAGDLAALNGSGLSGTPLGLVNQAGIGSFSGSSASLTTFTNAFVSLGDGLGQRGGVGANRGTAGLLRSRAETTGSTKTLWSGQLTEGTVIDYPARSTTALPSGMAIVGSWEYLVIATWGGGIELSINPYGDGVTGPANFAKGIVGFRAMLTMDAGAIYPGAFTVATGVT
jgi:HK97 family phage major capsid protein